MKKQIGLKKLRLMSIALMVLIMHLTLITMFLTFTF